MGNVPYGYVSLLEGKHQRLEHILYELYEIAQGKLGMMMYDGY